MKHYINKNAYARLQSLEAINHQWQESLKVRCYENARILPPRKSKLLSGGVCDSNGYFIEDTALHEECYDGSYQYEETEVTVVNRDALFIGSWIGIYGHAITDNLKKLWPLMPSNKAQYVEGEGNLDIVYNYLSGEKLPDYIITILSTLGIDERRLKRIDKVTQYNNVYIPDNGIILRHGVRYYTSEYKAIIRSIVETCNRYHSIANKIYLTRSKIRDGKDYGEKEIESSFEQKGYLIMSPESLSFAEQVNTVNNCRDIVTTEGSVSHNALFCKEGANLFLLRKYESFNGYQLMINDMNHLHVTYIDAHHTIKRRNTPWAGPFFLWKTTFLNAYLNDTPNEKTRWISVLWYKYIVKYLWLCYVRPAMGYAKRVLLK